LSLYILIPLTLAIDRNVVIMLEKAGFIQKSRMVTIDENGNPTEIIEVNIEGRRYGVEMKELYNALRGKVSARTFKIRTNWKQYVGSLAGLAYLSHSGRALNFEFIDGSKFTVSLDSLKSLLAKKSGYAPVARLPISTAISTQRPAPGPQRALPLF
jgi:hypothetical protein